MYQLPEKQKLLLMAIAAEGKVTASSAIKGLLDKGLATGSHGTYQMYDHFFRLWITRRYL